jgi:hypothetical protein
MLINEHIPISGISIQSSTPNVRNTTISGRDIVMNMASQKWVLTISTSVMSERDYMAAMSSIFLQAGSYGEFQVKLPIGSSNMDFTDGFVDGAATSGSDTVAMLIHGAVNIGTFVRFGNHSKVYMVKSYTSTSIGVYPDLVEDVPLNTSIIFNQPDFTVRLQDDSGAFNIGSDNISQKFDFNVIEVI